MAESGAPKTQVVQEHFGKGAQFYDASPFFPLCGERLVALAEPALGHSVLDVATGTGAALFPAASRVGPRGRVVGIDFADPMVARAAAEIERRQVSNTEVQQMDCTRLEFADSTFDTVLCGFALWFIPDLAKALSEIRRVLRPGGQFVVSTWGPQLDLPKKYAELFRQHGGANLDLSSHNLSSAATLSEVLEAAGFEVLYAADEKVSATYSDEETWWEQRMATPHVSESSLDDFPKFKTSAFEMIRGFKGEGGIREDRIAVFAVTRNTKQS